MQLAIDNLNGVELKSFSFNSERMSTEFVFGHNLRLRCKPYADATPDEECWMLFMPDGKVAMLQESGLNYEPADQILATSLARR